MQLKPLKPKAPGVARISQQSGYVAVTPGQRVDMTPSVNLRAPTNQAPAATLINAKLRASLG